MLGPRRRRVRRVIAIVTALLWLCGVEVLPNLHLAFHGDDHTHHRDGTIVLHRAAHDHAEPHAHAHDDDARPHHHPRVYPRPPTDASHRAEPARRRGPSRLAIDVPASGHAAAGIAHHAVALHAPPPPLLAPVAARHVVRWQHTAPHDRLASATRRRPTARGPPVA